MGVKIDFSEVYALAARLKEVSEKQKVQKMMKKIVNEALAKHVARTVAGTPVKTGYLRESWAHGIKPARFAGKTCVARLSNSLEYASYVENGHRTRNGKGWVAGRFMMSKSMGKVKEDLKNISETEIKRLLGGAVDGK